MQNSLYRSSHTTKAIHAGRGGMSKNENPNQMNRVAKKASPVLLQKRLDNQIINYSTSFNDELHKSFKVDADLEFNIVPYSNGAILEIKAVSDAKQNPIHLKASKDNIAEAFDDLGIEIRKYLPANIKREYDNPLTNKNTFFAGTNILYSSNRFYIIKEKEKDLWSSEAVKKDIQRIKSEAQKLNLIPA